MPSLTLPPKRNSVATRPGMKHVCTVPEGFEKAKVFKVGEEIVILACASDRKPIEWNGKEWVELCF